MINISILSFWETTNIFEEILFTVILL